MGEQPLAYTVYKRQSEKVDKRFNTLTEALKYCWDRYFSDRETTNLDLPIMGGDVGTIRLFPDSLPTGTDWMECNAGGDMPEESPISQNDFLGGYQTALNYFCGRITAPL